MNSITSKQAREILAFETPRYIFRRFNLLREVRLGENFIEIGAGNMRFSRELSQRFQYGVAVEYSEQTRQLYDILHDTHFPNVQLINDAIEEVQTEDQFDLVIACEVMEHVEDDLSFFEKMLQLSKSGGQIVFTVPARMKFWSDSDENVGHFRRYEKADIHKLMEDYEINQYKILSYGHPFINGFRLLRESKARREKQELERLTKVEQSALSGFPEIPSHYPISKYLVNRYTMWLPALFSLVFNRFDWSEGYIVVIEK